MCCGAKLENLYYRLSVAATFCLANDAVACIFYTASAIWGYSRAGLARTDTHECYIANGYSGHIVAGTCALVQAMGAVGGVALTSSLLCCTSEGRQPARNSMYWKVFIHWTGFQIFWMVFSWIVEIYVGFELPGEQCHIVEGGQEAEDDNVEETSPTEEPGSNTRIATLVVFFLLCWGFSLGVRITMYFYVFETLHNEGAMPPIAAGAPQADIAYSASGPQVVGVPVSMPSNDGGAPATVCQARTSSPGGKLGKPSAWNGQAWAEDDPNLKGQE